MCSETRILAPDLCGSGQGRIVPRESFGMDGDMGVSDVGVLVWVIFGYVVMGKEGGGGELEKKKSE